MNYQAISIHSTQAEKNKDGYIIVRYNKDRFKANIIVILTPYWKGQRDTVGSVATVVDITASEILIDDYNYGANYYLNVLLIADKIDDLHGLLAYANINQKQTQGALTINGHPQMPNVNLLTSYWKQGRVGNIETIVSVKPPKSGTGYSKIGTTSNNGAIDYFVNHLSLGAGANHFAQAGIVNKPGSGLVKIMFSQIWETPPLVFVTPYWEHSINQVGHIETVSNVTESYFEVISGNYGENYYLHWLAVPASFPNPSKAHVDKAFTHFINHFPKHKDYIEKNRTAFENIIINDFGPELEMLTEEFDNKPQHPKAKKTPISPKASAIAKVCVDCASLLIGAIGISINLRANTVIAIAEELENAPSEVTALVGAAEKLAQAQRGAASTKALATHVLKVSTLMFGAGLFRAIIVGMSEDMSKYQWVVTGISLIAQLSAVLLAIVVTDGAGSIAIGALWTARIVSMVGAADSLVIDSITLGKVLNENN